MRQVNDLEVGDIFMVTTEGREGDLYRVTDGLSNGKIACKLVYYPDETEVEFISEDEIVVPQYKSNEELSQLKSQWLRDPNWDIEDTPGFEAHYDSLLKYREETEKEEEEERKAERFEEEDMLSSELKCSMEVARKFIDMQSRIDRLEGRLETLWYEYRTGGNE